MFLQLPQSLHYPITVIQLLKKPNEDVERFAPLFSYSYKTTVTEGDKFGNIEEVEKSFPANFESIVAGTLKRWIIHQGMVIQDSGYEHLS